MPVVAKIKPKTQANRRHAVELFEQVCGEGEHSADEVVQAFDELEQRYRPSYVRLIYQICRSAFSWWPKDVKYEIIDSEPRITMAKKEVAAMIRASVDILFPEVRARLFIATVYGARRIEISEATSEDIRDGRIFIRTAKGGVQRWHLIPDVGLELLNCDLGKIPIRTLTSDFHFLEHAAGLGRLYGRGWHSIRRSLATRFAEQKANPLLVKKFMRWRGKDMYEHYVNLDVTEDQEIFDIHPFLGYWEAAYGS